MKKIMILVGLILTVGINANAAAPGAGGGAKSLARTVDASGYPVLFNGDKPWKVFEVAYTATAAQVVDEKGHAPAQGIVGKICMESAPAIPATNDWAILWDTLTAADMTASGTGRRIAPPIQRVSGVESCTDLNVEFTSGLGIKQGAATGSTYVYWR